MISEKFKLALKTSHLNQYTIAQRAGISQSYLSQIKNEIVSIKENDPRVINVGRILGLEPEDCFE